MSVIKSLAFIHVQLEEAVLYALILLVTLGVLLAAVIVREPPRL